jgi:hypothetical protein
MSAALFARENHSVPVKKLPIRRDGATASTRGTGRLSFSGRDGTSAETPSDVQYAAQRARAQDSRSVRGRNDAKASRTSSSATEQREFDRLVCRTTRFK